MGLWETWEDVRTPGGAVVHPWDCGTSRGLWGCVESQRAVGCPENCGTPKGLGDTQGTLPTWGLHSLADRDMRACSGRQPIMQTIMAGKMEMVLPAMYMMKRFMGICFSGARATSQQRCNDRGPGRVWGLGIWQNPGRDHLPRVSGAGQDPHGWGRGGTPGQRPPPRGAAVWGTHGTTAHGESEAGTGPLQLSGVSSTGIPGTGTTPGYPGSGGTWARGYQRAGLECEGPGPGTTPVGSDHSCRGVRAV